MKENIFLYPWCLIYSDIKYFSKSATGENAKGQVFLINHRQKIIKMRIEVSELHKMKGVDIFSFKNCGTITAQKVL